MEKEEDEEEQAAAWASFPSDLLPEILSRVPYRSLCRLKSVSRAWLALGSAPAVRRRSPQTLSGFFCMLTLCRVGIRFLNLSGRGRPMVDPSLPFLRGFGQIWLLNCRGGLLLLSCWDRIIERWVYVVCNPATEEIWAAQTHEPGPQLANGNNIICLCFDPAVLGRFAVFVFIQDAHDIMAVQVYSSDNGEWASMASGWGPGLVLLHGESGYVFLNGTLHFIAYETGEATLDQDGNKTRLIVTVDRGGNTWRTIRMPPRVQFSFIGQSQGRLCGMQVDNGNDCRISAWVLEDYASGQWTLKHTASVLELLGRPCSSKPGDFFYTLVAIHPECNLIFFAGGVKPEKTLMSYDMDNKKLHAICNLEEYDTRTFRLYVPCFAERLGKFWSSFISAKLEGSSAIVKFSCWIELDLLVSGCGLEKSFIYWTTPILLSSVG